MASQGRKTQGHRNETLAQAYLQRQGLSPVARNHRCKRGEIDLIMRDGETLVFVEVRYRRSPRFGDGAESVTPRKQARLAAAAQHYLQHHGSGFAGSRFDVVSVTGNGADHDIRWIRDAFRVAQ